ncbi:hypothetical protein ATANTOWER_020516, partial [Ataeniobius toweri]|nr:hypothetical protein [Ataeniobius toweri]
YKCGHAAEDSGAHWEAPAGEAATAGRGQEATRGNRGAQHIYQISSTIPSHCSTVGGSSWYHNLLMAFLVAESKIFTSLCQEQLPATGVPMRKNRSDLMQDNFNEYVKSRTLQNWKFWIFSIIIKPLFESFNGMVSTTSREELCHTTLQWLDNHCSLPVLRP